MIASTVRPTDDWDYPTDPVSGSRSTGETYASTYSTAAATTVDQAAGRTNSTAETYAGTATSYSSASSYSSSIITNVGAGTDGATASASGTQSGSGTAVSYHADTYTAWSSSVAIETNGASTGDTYYIIVGTFPATTAVLTNHADATAGTLFATSYPSGTATSRTNRTYSGTSLTTASTGATYDYPSQTYATTAGAYLPTTTGETITIGTTSTATTFDGIHSVTSATTYASQTTTASSIVIGGAIFPVTSVTATTINSTTWTLTDGTYSTTTTTSPGSLTTFTWDYSDTYTTASTTDTSVNYDSTAAITGTEKTLIVATEPDGSGSTRYASFLQTSHTHSPLQDTIVLLSAGLDAANSNLGAALWTFHVSAAVWSVASTGVFTDFFQSVSGSDHTLTDARVFSTSQWAIPIVSASKVTDTAGVSRLLYNGGETTGTVTSVATTQTHAMGAVGTSGTAFTHTAFTSGYLSGTSFTTGTVTGYWDATSNSGTRLSWASSAATTVSKNSRVETSYTTLVSSYTITAAGTATGNFYLGLVSTVLSSVLTSQVTLTSSTWPVGDVCDQYSYTGGGPASFAITQILAESAARTSFTSRRCGISTAIRQPLLYLPPELSFTVPPHGFLGFGGSFTQPDQTVYLGTTQGLAAGSTFAAATLFPPPGEDFQEGRAVTFFPVGHYHPPSLFGVGLLASSLVEIPTALVTAISVAATWTSTYLSSTDTSTSTRLATHTLAVTGPITGEFFASEDLTQNSADTAIGVNGLSASIGGYAAGDNRMDAPATVRLPAGRVSWTTYAASDSTGGASASSQNPDCTITFAIPAGVAIRYRTEDILEARWVTAANTDHPFRSVALHQPPPLP